MSKDISDKKTTGKIIDYSGSIKEQESRIVEEKIAKSFFTEHTG